jgi:hypothetical protein
MPTLDQRPDHVLERLAAREKAAADQLGYDAPAHHRACCHILAILQARREGLARQVKALRVEVL